jgi:hypothetical protein
MVSLSNHGQHRFFSILIAIGAPASSPQAWRAKAWLPPLRRDHII